MKFLILFALIASAYAETCTHPKFSDIQTYTTKDAKINSNTAYVVQFRLKCSNEAKNVQLFSEINGKFLMSSTSDAGDVYQLSWTEENNKAQVGEIELKIYDEEGFANLKRAQRNFESSSKVKELTKITFVHQGLYKGPVISTAFLITVLFVGIFYWAMSTRSKIKA